MMKYIVDAVWQADWGSALAVRRRSFFSLHRCIRSNVIVFITWAYIHGITESKDMGRRFKKVSANLFALMLEPDMCMRL